MSQENLPSEVDKLRDIWLSIYDRMYRSVYPQIDSFLGALSGANNTQCYNIFNAADLTVYGGILKLQDIFLGNYTAAS